MADSPCWSAAEVTAELRRSGKLVVTFAGFGELGYQDEATVVEACRRELWRFEPSRTLINTGTLITTGFREGIALVYRVARELGFATSGVHPSIALQSPDAHQLSPHVEQVFFVNDETWGGELPDGGPSPTLQTLLDVSDELIVIGGGVHTAQELAAFVARRKLVRYHPAEMHHETSRDWFARRGVTVTEFSGAALGKWRELNGNGCDAR